MHGLGGDIGRIVGDTEKMSEDNGSCFSRSGRGLGDGIRYEHRSDLVTYQLLGCLLRMSVLTLLCHV